MRTEIEREPTMEEILTSIRKIVSDEAPEGGTPTSAPAHDVLELSHEVVETPPAPHSAPPPLPSPSSTPVPVDDLVFETVAPAVAAAAHSDIFSDHTRKAVEDTFDNISDGVEPSPALARNTAPIVPVDSSTVVRVFERAVRESFEPVLAQYLSDNSAAVIERMKPLIREWMNEHFPSLLEGAVRTEVERVVKARGTKR